MTQAIPKLTTFEEFVQWKPENGRYELHDGVIVKMQPTGDHEEIKGFLIRKLNVEFDRLNFLYIMPNQSLVKPPEKDTGYLPDVLVINPKELPNEPLWKKESTIIRGKSVPLVIEIVSTNWRTDYFVKFTDYEEMGIPEYWIADYLALGGKRFIGNPKQPTISVNYLIDGEYQISQFRGNDRIKSPTFPELNLTVEQIFRAHS
jgi:Uma2 family endonuclease